MILRALDRLRATHTCLAITHQTELLAYADVVYRLNDGQIIKDELQHTGLGSLIAAFSNVRRLAG